jgi:hypothetical protein
VRGKEGRQAESLTYVGETGRQAKA